MLEWQQLFAGSVQHVCLSTMHECEPGSVVSVLLLETLTLVPSFCSLQ